MTFEESFESVEKMREYLDGLPDVTEEELYRIGIYTDDDVYFHALLMAHTDEQAIAEFDLSFMYVHNVDEFGKPTHMVLESPVDVDGDRREIARLECYGGA